LCKADLVTGMVGEFPELQGIMGGYYARAQGESDAVADAIRDHYKPVGQGDDVPIAPVTVAVSLADKLDTLCSFWFINQKPSGSKDPFALRRAALAELALLQHNSISVPQKHLFAAALASWSEDSASPHDIYDHDDNGQALSTIDVLERNLEISISSTIERRSFSRIRKSESKETNLRFRILAGEVYRDYLTFLIDRLKVQQREAGVRHDLIDAVFSLGGEDDLVRLLARVKALQAYITTAEGANLLAAYKRAANILKQAESSSPSTRDGEGDRSAQPRGGGASPSVAGATATSPSLVDGEELALRTALDAAEPKAAAALSVEDFEGAMAALATLRAPIDAFFEAVMVNDPDQDKRAFRLGLLARFRDAVTQVADFSKIEG
jgi:glycyl-tRNA synthetase beta chain